MNQHATELSNSDKISAKDLKRQVVNIQLYAQYSKRDVLEEYNAKYWVQGKSLTTSRTSQSLDELASVIVNDVILLERVIKPWYDIEFVDGLLPKEKAPEGFVRYTAKPPESIRKELIELLKEKKEELAEQEYDGYLKQKQTHKVYYPKRRPVYLSHFRRI
jgi:hypothetical protein